MLADADALGMYPIGSVINKAAAQTAARSEP
jgi:hypothetical protein